MKYTNANANDALVYMCNMLGVDIDEAVKHLFDGIRMKQRKHICTCCQRHITHELIYKQAQAKYRQNMKDKANGKLSYHYECLDQDWDRKNGEWVSCISEEQYCNSKAKRMSAYSQTCIDCREAKLGSMSISANMKQFINTLKICDTLSKSKGKSS